jgi:hypothetical protein
MSIKWAGQVTIMGKMRTDTDVRSGNLNGRGRLELGINIYRLHMLLIYLILEFP